MKKITLSLLGLLWLLSACNHNVYYSDIQTLPKERWKASEPLTFTMDIVDSMDYFNMFFNVRNTTDFETQNLYVFMKTQYPDGHSERDTLEFILCDKQGRWTGRGQGRIKDNKFLFQPKVRFPNKGTYTFTVTQAMRTDELKGISDFGITLERFK
ncbi:MAG: gliding motility lipoprotein GldH [Bacteroidales bacterium]|nr:gliding motility lipoprotein GldH [Bacteroidales bacterium]